MNLTPRLECHQAHKLELRLFIKCPHCGQDGQIVNVGLDLGKGIELFGACDYCGYAGMIKGHEIMIPWIALRGTDLIAGKTIRINGLLILALHETEARKHVRKGTKRQWLPGWEESLKAAKQRQEELE